MPGDKKWELFIPYLGKDPKKGKESSEEFLNWQKGKANNNTPENKESNPEHKLINTAMAFNSAYKEKFNGDSLFSIKIDKNNGTYEIVLNEEEIIKHNLFKSEEEIGPESPEKKKTRLDIMRIVAPLFYEAPVETKNPLEMAKVITKELAELKKLSEDKPETKN